MKIEGDSPDAESEIPLNVVDRHVGARIRARRESLGLTHVQLSETIAVSPAELIAFELGTARIGFEQQRRVAEALNVTDRYFYEDFRGANAPGSEDRTEQR